MTDGMAAAAYRDELLARLEHLLAHSDNMAPEEWALVASLTVEAAGAVGWSESGWHVRCERFDSILFDLRGLTDNFTSPAFLGATRAARRRNVALFT